MLAAVRPLNTGSQTNLRAAKRDVVLYVEDDPVNFRVAEVILGKTYEVVHAPNDQIACSLLRMRGAEFAAILMDVQLIGSKLDGIELARLVRGTLRRETLPAYAERVPVLAKTPIIFLTAYGSLYPEAVLVNAGGNRVISKPVNAATLELALTTIVLERFKAPQAKPGDPTPRR